MSIANILLGYTTAAAAAVTDAYFKYVTMLLPGNGTNGAQNNTFLDSSTNNFSITRNGNTTQGTFSPYGSNWSNYFDGTTDYLTVGSSANFGMGTGTFSFECWVFPTANPTNGPGTVFDARSAATSEGWVVRVFADRTIGLYDGPNNTYVYSTGTVTLNQWNHIAVVRSSTSSGGVAFYINGAASGTATVASNLGTSWSPWIGGNRTAGYDFNGYISNLRVVKGATVYTGAFTPSTTPLTTYGSGTNALLTCQSNRFVDNSGNSLSFTVNGTPSVQLFSPFSPSAAYSAATIGGSGYFDGTGDYLVSAASATLGLGSGNFTVEGWFYSNVSTGAGNGYYLCDYGPESTNRVSFLVYSNRLYVYNGAYQDSGLTVLKNQWNHFAWVRNGSTVTPYLNGVAGTAYTDSTNLAKTTTWYIGSDDTGTSNFNGWMSDFRVVVGTAVYTAAFTPPTSPLTAITNTKLLCNMTNAGVIDNAMMNDLETVGNAQISTTQSKFGGSSIYIDGTNDGLAIPASVNLAMGTGDFTIEMWIYGAVANNNTAKGGSFARAFTLGTAQGTGNIEAYFNDSNNCVISISAGSNISFASSSVLSSSWVHFAIVRSGTTLTAYANGTSVGSTTNSTNLNLAATTQSWIGAISSTAGTFNGYIDDFRITKGYARYTANFTPPTAAFPTQ